ncbi:MAG: TetR/AcrR family transcriptional regulator [Actinomycetota bacterium]
MNDAPGTPRNTFDYFQAALTILGEGGLPALTISNLCAQLGITKGSFYHHFTGWDDFVQSFLDHWEQEQIHGMTRNSAPADAGNRLATIIEAAGNVPHAAETAIRAWAASSPAVAQAQKRVDTRRLQFAVALFTSLIDDPERAEWVARSSLAMFVGLQQLEPRLDSDSRRKLIQANLKALLGPDWR